MVTEPGSFAAIVSFPNFWGAPPPPVSESTHEEKVFISLSLSLLSPTANEDGTEFKAQFMAAALM